MLHSPQMSTVLGHALASALSLILAVRGVAMTTAIWITLALSIQIFFLMISQYTVFSDIKPGKQNWIELFGAFVVFIAAVTPPAWEVLKAKFDTCTSSHTEANERLIDSDGIQCSYT